MAERITWEMLYDLCYQVTIWFNNTGPGRSPANVADAVMALVRPLEEELEYARRELAEGLPERERESLYRRLAGAECDAGLLRAALDERESDIADLRAQLANAAARIAAKDGVLKAAYIALGEEHGLAEAIAGALDPSARGDARPESEAKRPPTRRTSLAAAEARSAATEEVVTAARDVVNECTDWNPYIKRLREALRGLRNTQTKETTS